MDVNQNWEWRTLIQIVIQIFNKMPHRIKKYAILTPSDSTDIFLNQLIQFYSNHATDLHHLTPHSICRVALQHRDHIVATYYSDVTSPYV